MVATLLASGWAIAGLAAIALKAGVVLIAAI